jgi:hypothetical protein
MSARYYEVAAPESIQRAHREREEWLAQRDVISVCGIPVKGGSLRDGLKQNLRAGEVLPFQKRAAPPVPPRPNNPPPTREPPPTLPAAAAGRKFGREFLKLLRVPITAELRKVASLLDSGEINPEDAYQHLQSLHVQKLEREQDQDIRKAADARVTQAHADQFKGSALMRLQHEI